MFGGSCVCVYVCVGQGMAILEDGGGGAEEVMSLEADAKRSRYFCDYINEICRD